jgi:hypothetical protein
MPASHGIISVVAISGDSKRHFDSSPQECMLNSLRPGRRIKALFHQSQQLLGNSESIQQQGRPLTGCGNDPGLFLFGQHIRHDDTVELPPTKQKRLDLAHVSRLRTVPGANQDGAAGAQ